MFTSQANVSNKATHDIFFLALICSIGVSDPIAIVNVKGVMEKEDKKVSDDPSSI